MLARVVAAREAIVEAGLDAVHGGGAADAGRRLARPAGPGGPAASRRVRSDG